MNTKISTLKYFTYTRKSSEDSQRQVASIDDQTNALRLIVDRESLNLVRSYKEEKSAKDPGRPVFNELLNAIERGEANAIICWDTDRLSRNPIDNGRLQWMLQKGVIQVIKTPGRSYYPEDAGLLMSIEGGRATDYVIRLSKNVIRGLDSRVAKGWRPGLAPIGYKNSGDKGGKTVEPDEKNFETVRKMWDLFLTGTYSVTSILDIANNKWGLRTTMRRRLGGKPLSHAQIYKMFKEPFYYGYFWWKNSSTGEKELIKGSHQPMITEKEYWRAQVLLGRKGKPQPKTRKFYATGLIRCGECNGTVTAEEKHQIICTKCKHKFGYEGRTTCKCGTDISEMTNPTILHYTYFHCTKKINKNCTQKSIRIEDLESQFNNELSKIQIDEDYLKLALDYLSEKQQNSGGEEKKIRDLLQEAYDNCQTRLKNLHREFTSPQNSSHDIYTSEEYVEQKKIILKERVGVEKELNLIKTNFDHSIEASERTFNFCTFAKAHFNNTDDIQKKRDIFSTIGSNLTLKDKILNIERLHPYLLIENELKSQKALFASVEPKKRGYNKRKEAAKATSILTWRRR